MYAVALGPSPRGHGVQDGRGGLTGYRVGDHDDELLISVLTLGEVLVKPMEIGDEDPMRRYELVIGVYYLTMLGRRILVSALDIRESIVLPSL